MKKLIAIIALVLVTLTACTTTDFINDATVSEDAAIEREELIFYKSSVEELEEDDPSCSRGSYYYTRSELLEIYHSYIKTRNSLNETYIPCLQMYCGITAITNNMSENEQTAIHDTILPITQKMEELEPQIDYLNAKIQELYVVLDFGTVEEFHSNTQNDEPNAPNDCE